MLAAGEHHNRSIEDLEIHARDIVTHRGSLVAVAAGRVGLLGRDLASLVADNEGADGEGLLLLLVGGVVEARATLFENGIKARKRGNSVRIVSAPGIWWH
jgi:hypothetical protein